MTSFVFPYGQELPSEPITDDFPWERSVNAEDTKIAYFKWNLYGEGKEHQPDTGGLWYRGNTLYSENTPSWRMIPLDPRKQAGAQTHGMLMRYVNVFQNTNTKPLLAKIKCCWAPDLGVFSRFEGDQMADDDTHERVKYVMLMRVRELVFETVPRKNGLYLSEEWRAKQFRDQLAKWHSEWKLYNETFALGWGDMPDMYAMQLETVIKQRVDAYQDPAAVAQRERAKARKVALEALGLDNTKVA